MDIDNLHAHATLPQIQLETFASMLVAKSKSKKLIK